MRATTPRGVSQFKLGNDRIIPASLQWYIMHFRSEVLTYMYAHVYKDMPLCACVQPLIILHWWLTADRSGNGEVRRALLTWLLQLRTELLPRDLTRGSYARYVERNRVRDTRENFGSMKYIRETAPTRYRRRLFRKLHFPKSKKSEKLKISIYS